MQRYDFFLKPQWIIFVFFFKLTFFDLYHLFVYAHERLLTHQKATLTHQAPKTLQKEVPSLYEAFSLLERISTLYLIILYEST